MPVFTPKTAAVAVVFSLVGAVTAIAVMQPELLSPAGPAVASGKVQTREFNLTIEGADIDIGGGSVWHAWTYNGTVPGPTLEANVGDVIRVTVTNTLNLTHSLHTHLSPYSLESDGSQLNTISGIGGMAMIPPGGSYTYEFLANIPGLVYYHCHSADGGHGIQKHMAQGLYGAIIVHPREESPMHEESIFMAERGFNVTGSGGPFYIMNGHGMPGGEAALEHLFHEKGIDAVKAALGTTVPVIQGKVGVPMRLNVVNIGDFQHTFHLHAMTMYSEQQSPGEIVSAQVIGLLPGEAERVVVTPNEAGFWLFHCHVVSHADAGMIGVFVVEPA